MSSMGCLELLNETELNNQQKDLARTIASSIGVLLMLIEDILELNKIEFENKEGTVQKNNHMFSLGESLSSLKTVAQGYADQMSVYLDFDIQKEAHDMVVESNKSRLHQILSNLLTNAVKASKQHGKVELSCRILQEDGDVLETNRRRVCFKVRDYGSGIPKDKIEAIFEPFTQLHNVNESKFPR